MIAVFTNVSPEAERQRRNGYYFIGENHAPSITNKANIINNLMNM